MQTTKGRGRGVLALQDCRTPLRRPKAFQIETSSIHCDIDTITSPEIKYTSSWADCDSDTGDNFKEGESLLVKFTYNANPDTPLDEPELSVRQKDNVAFIKYYPQNKMWCKVQIRNTQGYVPSSYLMSVGGNDRLPWLKSPPEIPQEKVEYKPYKSAYARDTPKEVESVTSYRCDICSKDFNGPQPYTMHMKSKAHREEVEAQQGY
ncbi:uncharacterized protein LOC130050157 [Ostrea edulis]|uniref:uncharacterized protein LOC130050157 n=1 Tax=Ostrea edulis TaxID=37623 RepID=UPI0024AEEB8E|nr:uncharacterized protein LOC130050157 [Ostrea edulis]XP_056005249.1 uncharacterized protein LOC130050157 [Ostrea edulis]XP_056005250.1 uncharacterized protein LOC130050157 [Ostrea edulis]